jgi:periodic tryptophan protein 2
MTTPHPTQFTSLALDPSGEVVCAGAMDTFDIFVWSVQTGKLLDILGGHEGPVSALAFNPVRVIIDFPGISFLKSILASVSWDGYARIWDIFESKGSKETFKHQTDVLAVAFRPGNY